MTRIVTFHDIPDEGAGDFRRNLLWLKKAANVVSLNDFASGRLSAKRINVVITFDDGYRSWMSRAVPLLKELSMPATFFVASGFLDLCPVEAARFVQYRLRRNSETTGVLRRQDLQGIVEDGFTVGGHTCNHVNLAQTRDREEIRREVVIDKQVLEKITRREIKYFAYPFGECCNPSTDILTLLKEVGYKAAVTLIPGFNRNGANRYMLFREITGLPMPVCVFRARVLGAYDGVNVLRRGLGLTCYESQ